jgi:hypothetical protein
MSTEGKSAAQREYFERTWRHGVTALEQFRTREGHCRVPRNYIEGTYRLGQWVAVQRYHFLTGVIAPVRKAQLDELGFVWSRRDWLWETGFAALKTFKAREGHCLVRALHIEGNLKLGLWVSTQRRKKNTMTDERKQRLNDLGFVWKANDRAKFRPRPRLFDRHDAPLQTSVHALN